VSWQSGSPRAMLREGLQRKSFLSRRAKRLQRKARPVKRKGKYENLMAFRFTGHAQIKKILKYKFPSPFRFQSKSIYPTSPHLQSAIKKTQTVKLAF